MKTIEIEVPGMQSSHCELKVKNAIAKIRNTEADKISAGKVIVNVETESTQASILDAIEKAGYEVKKVNVISDEIMKFKTNINCSGCVAQVTPALNNAEGICHWDVDTNSPDKILTVHSEGITDEEVIFNVKKAGFNIEKLS
jgi:copper chaperone CopZ